MVADDPILSDTLQIAAERDLKAVLEEAALKCKEILARRARELFCDDLEKFPKTQFESKEGMYVWEYGIFIADTSIGDGSEMTSDYDISVKYVLPDLEGRKHYLIFSRSAQLLLYQSGSKLGQEPCIYGAQREVPAEVYLMFYRSVLRAMVKAKERQERFGR